MVLSFAAAAHAQTTQVSGTVVDEAGLGVPGASVQLVGASRRDLATSGQNGAYTFSNVAPGNYQLTATLVGFAPATPVDVVVSSTNVSAPALSLKVASLAETVVVSATKGDIALVDAPATMSVLTSAELQSSPAQNYGDLLRRVPGLNVIQLSARDINITSRQATATLVEHGARPSRRPLRLPRLFRPRAVGHAADEPERHQADRGHSRPCFGRVGRQRVDGRCQHHHENASRGERRRGDLYRRVPQPRRGIESRSGPRRTRSASTAAVPTRRTTDGLTECRPAISTRRRFPVQPVRFQLSPIRRDATLTVGGAAYPADGPGPLGTAYANRGTSQPKFDARVDQELGKNGRITYEGGVAGTQGVIYTGIGPFDIQSGSYLGFGRVNYTRNALKLNFFTNILSADAPNLLFPDPFTGKALQLTLTTKTYDVEVGNATPVGSRNIVSYGGNYRRNNFAITLAPAAQDRNETGAYVQDECS